MTVKELAKSRLELRDGKLVIKKDSDFFKDIKKGNILEFQTDGTVAITAKQTVTLKQRFEDHQKKFGKKGSQGSEENNLDARVDVFQLDKDELEVAAAKVLNQVVNNQDYADEQYFIVKLIVGVTNVDDSLLELMSPDMMKVPTLLQKRDKATYDEKTHVVVKRVGPFRYELSTTVPAEYGAISLFNREGLNGMIEYISQMMANIMEYNYTSGEIKVSNEVLAKHSLAMSNKSRIKNHIIKVLRDIEGEEVSDIDIWDEANDKVDEIWDILGVKPLTDKRLDVELQILKIHRSNDPFAFTSKRRSVSILKDDTGSIKLERLNVSVDKSVPYLVSQEKQIAEFLTNLVGHFTVWAENEARHCLDYEPIINNYKLRKLYPDNKKVLSVLGYNEEQQKEMTDKVAEIITQALGKASDDMKADALAKSIQG